MLTLPSTMAHSGPGQRLLLTTMLSQIASLQWLTMRQEGLMPALLVLFLLAMLQSTSMGIHSILSK
jgi:hypothetical protein